MANTNQEEILKNGVADWNRWRKKNPQITPNISGCNFAGTRLVGVRLTGASLIRTNFSQATLSNARLDGADLTKADLFRVNLNGANLQKATLVKANLYQADLRGADLRGAFLIGTCLCEADLKGADLCGAVLRLADLSRASLSNTNFTDATLGFTVLANVDLQKAKGLESIHHIGPSSVGIDTVYNSRGEIPGLFLKKAGVPDSFVTNMKSLVGHSLEFYSCFISYSTSDQDFADRLHADLQSRGVRCWFAPYSSQGGKKLHDQIDEAIRIYDRLLLVLSRSSLQSEWVKTEIAKARQKEIREKRRVLFPIRLVSFDELRAWECFDADTGKDSAREIREYFIPDFSNWKDHEAYQASFARLISDLKA